MIIRTAAAMLMAALVAGGCTSVRESRPERTATEQLLISTAVDKAADQLGLQIPDGTRIFVDAVRLEGPDTRYAEGVIRDRLLRGGARLVNVRSEADAVVELRAGALSIDEKQTLVGIPGFEFPVPLTGPMPFPEIALFKEKERIGVAKIAATSYAVDDGRLIASSGAKFGYSHDGEATLLLFSWRTSDLPREEEHRLIDRW